MLLRLQEARTAGDEAMIEYRVLVERAGEDFGATREEDVKRFLRHSAREVLRNLRLASTCSCGRPDCYTLCNTT